MMIALLLLSVQLLTAIAAAIPPPATLAGAKPAATAAGPPSSGTKVRVDFYGEGEPHDQHPVDACNSSVWVGSMNWSSAPAVGKTQSVQYALSADGLFRRHPCCGGPSAHALLIVHKLIV